MNKIFFLCMGITFFALSCSSNKQIILEEVRATKKVEVRKIPPITASIIEIELSEDVQKYIYFNAGKNSSKRLRVGMKGSIQRGESQIGQFRVIEIYRTSSKGRIIELTYPVSTGDKILIP